MEEKIYHAAPISVLPSILEHGIVPRSPDHEGSWPGEPSTEGFVYLTVAHAIWYAIAPTSDSEAVILELNLPDVPVFRRYPDEDYLEQETWWGGAHQDDPAWSLDIRQQQNRWNDSLQKLGNIAVEGVIPPTMIGRYAILKNDYELWEQMISRRLDRQILQYQAQKASLQNGLSFIFDVAPSMQKLSRRDFNSLLTSNDPDDRRFWRDAVQAVQVVTRKGRQGLSQAQHKEYHSLV